MTTEIPGELLPFVRRLVAAKRFLKEGDVVAERLRLLHAREALRDEVRRGIFRGFLPTASNDSTCPRGF